MYRDYERAFTEGTGLPLRLHERLMPKHDYRGVEMSEQAGKKATHPELKELAAKMAKDQKEEIKQMKGWGTILVWASLAN